ncbi:MAG: UDP-N-acetylmuramoyl-L-alanine--D-glutamate ligase, partial [Deltaproteobacteria bacterium]|nr:UDP-N-acetylmuramoyl-L-alanine--D-glutamate ligase [Deltaproteobacteria bacterium]
NAGLSVFVGGNIGTPLMEYALEGIRRDFAVVEVSSFQLDTMETFRPQVSLLLNIAPDHLDRYPDYDAYAASKLRIWKNQGRGQVAILNDDDPRLALLRPEGDATFLRYAREKGPGRHAYMEGGRIHAAPPGTGGHTFSLEGCRLPGRHNLENMTGAVLAGLLLGLEPLVLQRTIDTFQGLPHRLEWVARIRGVDFYDDSKATNVDAAARSVDSFDRPVILIAGGRHKGADYGPLVEAARGRVKQALFLGESRDLLARAFRDVIPFAFAGTMRDAVSAAFSLSEPEDVVLLAPACSSFDMFSDYARRGAAFKEAVEELEDG